MIRHLITLCIALVCGAAAAQDSTANLITNSWTGTVPYTGTGGGTSGGATPGYNSTTNTIHFGYNVGTAAQIIAINNALSGSGVQISGYNYSWQYYNQDSYRGTLNGAIKLTNANGTVLEQYAYAHPTTTQGWTTMSGTQNFSQQYGLSVAKNLEVSFTGNDATWWAGYYGPMVRDVNVSLRYSAATVTNPTFGDDTYVAVPLQFGFPFYGKTFTNSWMHSNGVVSFFDPAVPVGGTGFNPGTWAYCCGERVTGTRPEFSYIIAPLMTDLYPSTASTFRTEGTTTYQKYFWNNIGEISNGNNLNTFSLEIRPTGYIGVTYDQINIQTQNTWAGTAGDINAGQINEKFWGVPGLNAHQSSLISWTVSSTVDQCVSNPLSSPTCAGYAQAYLTQQCSISSLYSPDCPGYAVAYFNQQCSLDPLYDSNCTGYKEAYAKKQLLESNTTTTTTTTTTVVTTASDVTAQLSSGISDTTTSSVVTASKDTTNTTSPTSVIGPVSVIAPPPAPPAVSSAINSVSVSPPPTQAQQQERQQDQKKTDGAVATVERGARGNPKEAAKAAGAAAKSAVQKAQNARSMEDQAANQGLVVGLMGYVPGFTAYQAATVPDVLGAQVARQYNKVPVDNRNAQRRLSGANEARWQEIVDSQYQKGQ